MRCVRVDQGTSTADFGIFSSNALLVDNFSFLESEIHAFNPTTGALLGTIPIDVGAGNTPGGTLAGC